MEVLLFMGLFVVGLVVIVALLIFVARQLECIRKLLADHFERPEKD